MTSIGQDQAELLRALARHGVEMVVLGGIAAQLHGWTGITLDLDVAVDSSDTNVDRINRALASVGAGEPDYGQFGTSFKTRFGRLEIVRRADAVGDYSAWRARAREHVLEAELTILVADPGDILRSKAAAGREKDRAALPQMREDFLRSGALRD